MNYTNKLLGLLFIFLGMSSCFNEYIDKKPDQKLVVPTSMSDFQALLDNINGDEMNTDPSLGFISSDDFYITEGGFNGLSDIQQGAYLWADDVYGSRTVIQDWARPYRQVFYTNVVLEGLENLESKEMDSDEWNSLKGTALFFRASAYYNLAQLFRPPYLKSTADNTSGIPLKLKSDINEKPIASTLQQTYRLIIDDLNEAHKLLKPQTDIRSRPDKNAANAMLARVYLTMGSYELAEIHSDKVLALKSTLIDYNRLSTDSNRPFPPSLPYGNEEVIYHAVMYGGYSYIGNGTVAVDSVLYKSYDENDLRKALFFRNRGGGLYTFKGTYSPSLTGNPFAFFSGLAVDEILLIRAECRVRNNKVLLALADLNKLLSSRWLKDTYIPLSNLSKEEALQKILTERRKQLIGRGLRWTDLRRLNQESAYATEVYRVIKGQKYTLRPGDNRYTFPIPADETSEEIDQNPR